MRKRLRRGRGPREIERRGFVESGRKTEKERRIDIQLRRGLEGRDTLKEM